MTEFASRLEITTAIGCPCNCKACPQDKLVKAYSGEKVMSFDTFKECLNKVPKETRIDFSGMCEPFVNENCVCMMLYAYEQGYQIALYTTLKKSTKEDFQRLKHIPFNPCVIHVQDIEGNCNINVDESIVTLWREKASAYSVHGTPKSNYYPLITYLHDRAGNGNVGDHVEHPNCTYCGNDGWVLMPNGDMYLCCMDYSLEHKVGNLLTGEINVKPREVFKLCQKCINAR